MCETRSSGPSQEYWISSHSHSNSKPVENSEHLKLKLLPTLLSCLFAAWSFLLSPLSWFQSCLCLLRTYFPLCCPGSSRSQLCEGNFSSLTPRIPGCCRPLTTHPWRGVSEHPGAMPPVQWNSQMCPQMAPNATNVLTFCSCGYIEDPNSFPGSGITGILYTDLRVPAGHRTTGASAGTPALLSR
jgi:hypothetical protein